MPTIKSEQDLEHYLNEHDYYDALYDPLRIDRRERRKRRPRKQPPKAPEQWEVASQLGDVAGVEGGLKITYTPARYEEGWLLSSIGVFFEQALITDILFKVKGGKEASVYCCRAHPGTGVDLLAAKVYRPRMFRSLRNDKLYREGRGLLDGSGRTVQVKDERLMRAVIHGTEFGMQVRHTSWLMHEYTAMERLFKAGAAVPQPVLSSENAILMTYVGSENIGAPTLHEIRLDPGEVQPLFQETLRNIDLMMQHELIHGDLSAYNILYWDGQITLIDFPQVVSYFDNHSAYAILSRDVQRICDYFARYRVECDAQAITDELWQRYATPDPRIVFAEEYLLQTYKEEPFELPDD